MISVAINTARIQSNQKDVQDDQDFQRFKNLSIYSQQFQAFFESLFEAVRSAFSDRAATERNRGTEKKTNDRDYPKN